jgi:hypothetical protein
LNGSTRQSSPPRQPAPQAREGKLEPRAPLAGYEELYEISRSGRVFSRTTRAVLIGGYAHSPFIRITVNGAVVTLPKDKAVADSFAALPQP